MVERWLGGPLKKLTEIRVTGKDPSLHDVIVIGTPVWNGAMSASIRTYITRYKNCFRSVAFFCAQGSSKSNALRDIESLCGMKPIASLQLRRSEVEMGEYVGKAEEFAARIRKSFG